MPRTLIIAQQNMMDSAVATPVFLFGLAAVLLVIAIKLGFVSRHAFVKAPARVPLQGFDLWVALGLWLIGNFAAADFGRQWVPDNPVVTTARGIGSAIGPVLLPPATAWAMVFIMIAGQLPAAVYFVIRSVVTSVPANTMSTVAATGATEQSALGGLFRSGMLPRRPVSEFGFTGAGIVFGIVWMAAAGYAIQMLLMALGHRPPEVAHGLLVQLMAADQDQTRWAIMVSAVVVAPVLEEVIFRGLIQSAIRGGLASLFVKAGAEKMPDPFLMSRISWFAILIAGSLFGVVHGGVASLHALPMLALFGVILGWLYERTGSLWPGILVHAFYNGLNILVVMQMA